MATVKAGARITGILGFEEFGAGLTGGDFNGDGIADLAVNYRQIGSFRGDSSSTIQIIFGGEGVLEGELQSASLAGGQVTTSGTTDIGVGVGVPGPLSFSDVNGDGREDLLIGSPRALSNDAQTGGAGYILFGREGTDAFSFGLSNLTNGQDGQGFFSTGGRNAGSSILNLGDVDSDGQDELFVGVPFGQAPGSPALSGLGYIFERPNDAITDLAGALSEPPSVAASVMTSNERAFVAEDAAALGDVNGDGIADFLVTGRGAVGGGTGPFSRSTGEAYVIYGQQAGLPDRIDTSTLDGALGTRIFATDVFSVAGRAEAAGDVNGDGLGDFLLMDAGPRTDEPLVYVVYGTDGGLGASFDLSTSDGVSKLGGVPSAANANGVDMAGVGDVNGDGFDDILVSRAGGGLNGAGETALLFGSAQGFGDTLDLDNIPLSAGYRFQAPADQFAVGYAVTAPGDLNGDGVNDIVIGAPFFNPASNANYDFDAPGAVYVIYGGAERFAALDELDGADGIIALANAYGDIEIDDVAQPATYSLGNDFSIAERNGQDTTFAVTVTRGSDFGAATVALATSGSAQSSTSEADFSRIGGSTSFADGETETTVLYRVTDDLKVEFAEEIVFDLSIVSSDAAAEVADGQQVVTIQDDDEISFFSLGNDFSIAERNGQDTTFAINVTRTFAEGQAEISLATSGSGATDAFRFIGSNTFEDGETETQVLYRLVDDLEVEFAEEIVFDLSVVSSDAAAEIADGQQVVAIQDDDEISFFSLGNDFSIAERNGQDTTFGVTVTRSSDVGAATVALATSGSAQSSTSEADFSRIGGSNSFADGETETTVLYRLTDDLRVEFAEEIVFDLSVVSSDAAAEVTDGQQVVTIQDDDEISFFSLANDFSIAERNGQDTTFGVTVTRSSDVGAATVALATSGSAQSSTPEADFSRIGGSNSFADGETETTVLYRVTDDLRVEFAEEIVFELSVVSSDAAAEVTDGQQVVTIQDDDEISFFSLGNDFSIAERNGQDTTFAVTVTRTFAEGQAEIALATSGTGATDAFRFVGSNTFEDGETETQILFRLVDDTEIEATEELVFDLSVLSSDAAAEVADGQQIVSILDDDTPVTFSIGADFTVFESNGVNVGFTTFVTRSSGAGEAVVNIGLGGTATPFGPDRDYELVDTSVTFADGETSKAVRVNLTDDTIDEPDETIELGIIVASSTGVAIIDDGTQVITIVDDDDAAPVTGGSRSDRLIGTSAEDRISGQAGNDTIFALAGDDFVAGGSGRDFLFGGSGDDTVNGWTGSDLLSGGSGDDRLAGQDGDDTLRGDDGVDTLSGGRGDDSLYGGAGTDFLSGGTGNDRIEGNTGADRIFGGDGRDTLFGGSGNDEINGGQDRDVIFGNTGADTLRGDDGNDLLFGGQNNDFLSGGNGNDFLNGASGKDSLSGGSGNDDLDGGSGNDTLSGGFGNDSLLGGEGDDRLFGGSGRDFLRGGDGDDSMSGGSQNDLISGESGNDFLVGGSGQDTLLGGSGQDTLIGGAGDDVLFGGSGRDTFVFDVASGDDLIRDFRNGQDRIEISSGATSFSELQISSGGGAAIINFASVEIELDRFNANLLDASDFIFS